MHDKSMNQFSADICMQLQNAKYSGYSDGCNTGGSPKQRLQYFLKGLMEATSS